MKKIPTLFVREFEGNKLIGITDEVTPGFEWVLTGEGVATEKVDGSCCAFIDGVFYKRYDAKKGRKPPAGAIPCCDPDPETGHWPHWVPVDEKKGSDKWFREARENSMQPIEDGTYEAVGPHFQGNPYGFDQDFLIRHGSFNIDKRVPRTFEGIRDYLAEHYIEGVVFWKDGRPECKIKRTDFGFGWNGKL